MGVDYSAHYGIGQQIKTIDFDEEDNRPKGFENMESFSEYLEEIFYSDDTIEGFSYFETGEGNYTGEQNEFFIQISDAFSNGLDLSEKKKVFDEFINKHGFETIGDFGLIGGLEVH